MKFTKTKLEGVYIIRFESKKDTRGYFMRTFCQKECKDAGIRFSIVQVNRSFTNKRGAVRGMHFQTKPHEEAKFIQCLKGAIYDVVLDVRKRSKTFGKWVAVELSEKNNTALFIPQGYAHGFQTLQTNCEVEYFMSDYYSPSFASGVRCTDPFFHIAWPLPITFSSTKDGAWPLIGKNI